MIIVFLLPATSIVFRRGCWGESGSFRRDENIFATHDWGRSIFESIRPRRLGTSGMEPVSEWS